MTEPEKIVVLIGIHIETRKQLQLLMRLLTSIKNQIDYFGELNVQISLSHDQTILVDEIKFLMKVTTDNQYQVFYQENLMTVFEHYKFLISSISDEKTWIVLTDNNAIWANNRLAVYHYMINSLPKNESTFSVSYTPTNIKARYVDCSIKISDAKLFFDSASEEQLKHKFCEYYFLKFIIEHKSNILKSGHATSDEELYELQPIPEPTQTLAFDDAIIVLLDLYIATSTKPTAKEWIQLTKEYFDNKLTTDQIKHLITTYLNSYNTHIYNSNNLPK